MRSTSPFFLPPPRKESPKNKILSSLTLIHSALDTTVAVNLPFLSHQFQISTLIRTTFSRIHPPSRKCCTTTGQAWVVTFPCQNLASLQTFIRMTSSWQSISFALMLSVINAPLASLMNGSAIATNYSHVLKI